MRALLFIAIFATAFPGRGMCQKAAPANGKRAIDFCELRELTPVSGGEFLFGVRDRIYVIEDQWEWDRSSRLVPGLPKVDLETESLLVVTSWPRTARTIESMEAEGDILLVNITEKSPPEWLSGPYLPPTYRIAKMPRWIGPVRVIVNGQNRFTMLRGKALDDFSYETWEELLRLHSGGIPSGAIVKRHWKQQWPDASDEQLMEKLSEYRKNYHLANPAQFYPLLMRDLVDSGARDSIPRLFKLFEAMGEHDKAMQPAVDAVIALGGPQVVDHCSRALESENCRSRYAAMLILTRLQASEGRSLAYPHLVDNDARLCRGALNFLRAIGIVAEDGPHFVKALEELESRAKEPQVPDPRVRYTDWSTVIELIDLMLSLEEVPAEGNEVLERLATSCPVLIVQTHAEKALHQLKSRPSTTEKGED